MENFDLKKYLAEGRLNEMETPSDLYSDMLEDEIGYKVAAPSYNPKGDRLNIYPGSKPGKTQYYDDRAAQRISLAVDTDGNFYIIGIFGYDRSIEPIAQKMQLRSNRSNFVGMSYITPDTKILSTPTNLKRLADIMKKGLGDEARAQADFYRDRTPD